MWEWLPNFGRLSGMRTRARLPCGLSQGGRRPPTRDRPGGGGGSTPLTSGMVGRTATGATSGGGPPGTAQPPLPGGGGAGDGCEICGKAPVACEDAIRGKEVPGAGGEGAGNETGVTETAEPHCGGGAAGAMPGVGAAPTLQRSTLPKASS